MPVIPDLSLTISPYTALYKNLVPDSQVNAYETTTEGRRAIVLDFNSGAGVYGRDLGMVFSWPTIAETVLSVWQPSLVPQPEGIYGRATDWDDGGIPGSKFFQGVSVEADSFGNAKTLFIQDSDTLTLHALNECPTVFNGQTAKPFSCAPFIAHLARVISVDGVEWRIWNCKFVFQPWPSSTMNWQTEMTSLGLIGWGHVREMNIPYISTTTLTLVLTFDAWPTITLFLPSTGSVQTKTKVTLPANKFKLIGFQLSSTAPFTLFASDMEVKLGQWGREDSYKIIKPFGGEGSVGALV